MNAKEVADKLNGSQYPLHISREHSKEMRDNGIVVVYGASDDLMEFDGAIYDEIGCFGCGKAYVSLDGQSVFEEPEQCHECGHVKSTDGCYVIHAIWGENDISWQYETDIEHQTFIVNEDDDVYCVGIVFEVKDVM